MSKSKSKKNRRVKGPIIHISEVFDNGRYNWDLSSPAKRTKKALLETQTQYQKDFEAVQILTKTRVTSEGDVSEFQMVLLQKMIAVGIRYLLTQCPPKLTASAISLKNGIYAMVRVTVPAEKSSGLVWEGVLDHKFDTIDGARGWIGDYKNYTDALYGRAEFEAIWVLDLHDPVYRYLCLGDRYECARYLSATFETLPYPDDSRSGQTTVCFMGQIMQHHAKQILILHAITSKMANHVDSLVSRALRIVGRDQSQQQDTND